MCRKILIVHNRYQLAGGEDRVVEAEANLLRGHGHDVFVYTDDNSRIGEMGPAQAALNTVWSRTSARKLAAMIKETQADVCHFHNTFPLISPAAYYVARRAGLPVVQTLHNYRILCPGSLLMREGRVCETCIGRKLVWPGAVHRCYRQSYAASAVSAAAISIHNLLHTWSDRVDRYIALGEFGRQKFIQGGLPEEKIAIKPNFVDPDPGSGNEPGGYALFVGRLSPEKGLSTLLEAWSNHPEFPPLHIAGDGPLAPLVREACLRNAHVKWLGALSRPETFQQMHGARFLICPSTWYECFALVVVEAFACGLPVIASSLGALPELIRSEETGLLFAPGSAADLSAKVEWVLQNPRHLEKMRRHARLEYEHRYTAERNYPMLKAIYESAVAHVRPAAIYPQTAAA